MYLCIDVCVCVLSYLKIKYEHVETIKIYTKVFWLSDAKAFAKRSHLFIFLS